MLKSSEFGILYQKVDELWAFSPSIELLPVKFFTLWTLFVY